MGSLASVGLDEWLMPAPVDLDEWLTPPEVSRMTKLSVSTLKDKRWRGTGPKYQKLSPGRGGRIRYKRRDVLEWLQNGDTPADELAA
ncbi:helix-turn-helix transcriptional regulator [Streptomyces sp. NPDC057596]|uniref:helix-turn-helix transcriptional regulator n=1 Tax=Streptomyces sp. NPDC057596 TaxID=3346178 RepID=UPI00368B1905